MQRESFLGCWWECVGERDAAVVGRECFQLDCDPPRQSGQSAMQLALLANGSSNSSSSNGPVVSTSISLPRPSPSAAEAEAEAAAVAAASVLVVVRVICSGIWSSSASSSRFKIQTACWSVWFEAMVVGHTLGCARGGGYVKHNTLRSASTVRGGGSGNGD